MIQQSSTFIRVIKDDLGIGKITMQDRNKCVVEFFDSPFTPRICITLVPKEAEQISLFAQTRVFWFSEEDSVWQVGRIGEQCSNKYLVKFPNKVQKIIPQEDLFVRWNKPISDPTILLAKRYTETPFFHDRRYPFLRSLFEQRNACRGMTTLLSSCIDLELHQVEVVRRVLRDPIKRYLLADEVGLGKTIEAGLILRQYILEHPKTNRALLIVPKHLVVQWREELIRRFIPEKLLQKQIILIAHDDLNEAQIKDFSDGLVIIDEAHHLTSFNQDDHESKSRYDLLQTLTASSKILLLLSATPVLHNEEGFLHMLHLLDPENYSLADPAAFKRRIEKREEIALAYDVLVPGTFPLSLEEPAKQLVSSFPQDSRLRELVEVKLANQLATIELDGDKPELEDVVRRIRNHVGETYRLHRRLLRTRRSAETEDILPLRSGFKSLSYSDPIQRELFTVIDEWRQEMAEFVETLDPESKEQITLFAQFHICLLELAWGAPNLLSVLLEARQGDNGAQKILDGQLSATELKILANCPRLEGETYFYRHIHDILGERHVPFAQEKLMISQVKKLLESSDTKLIIFCSFPSCADHLYKILRDTCGDDVVTRHQVATPSGTKTRWKAFLNNGPQRLLVCDRQAEDGLNLQGNPGARFRQATILFADLPFNPNRIEQRIGRLDRYGHQFKLYSQAFCLEDCPLMQLWMGLLNESYGIFSRSIASLQYLIDQQMETLRFDLLKQGHLALSDCRKVLGEKGEEVLKELKRIKLQEGIDALDPDTMVDQLFFDNLTEIDSDGKHKNAAVGWISEILGFSSLQVDENEKVNKHLVRYAYNKRTLVPVDQLIACFDLELFDREWEGFNPSKPAMQPLSFNRSIAQHTGIRLARVGNAFIDAMASFLRQDDRGVSFALWRVISKPINSKKINCYFRFDFALEGDYTQAIKSSSFSLDVTITPSLLEARIDEHFPPLMGTVWLDSELNKVTQPEILKELAKPYDSETPSLDYNLNSERWELLDKFIDPNSWEELCNLARNKAIRLFKEQVGFETLVNDTLRKADCRFNDEKAQFEGRLQQQEARQKTFLLQEWKREELLYGLIIAALKKPRITIDSVGVVFLSVQNPFRDE